MANDQARPLLELLRSRGPSAARDVQAALGVSQPTLSRLVQAAGADIVRIGRARRTRYAAVRAVRTSGNAWPVYRVGANGAVVDVGTLHALHPRAWWWDVPVRPEWLVGDFSEGLFPDLPWFLDDLRPQGFLGRAFARRHGAVLGLGADPQRWDSDGVLAALLAFGDDLPGDFVVGDAAAARVERTARHEPDAVSEVDCLERYETLAQQAMAGDVAGSSAGGEQPKFTACVRDAAGAVRHVLVKFSPPLDGAAGRRWADLLRCEHLAAETLWAAGYPASTTRWHRGRRRAYLESTRFDRVGRAGRRGVVSLLALSAAHHGALDTWTAAADRLARDGWLSAADAETLRVLWWFGQSIGNTDMHFANVSFLLEDRRPLGLAPTYDMLPMDYRPSAAGEIVDRPFEPAMAPPRQRDVWRRAAELAVTFWERVAGDVEISDEFRGVVAGCAGMVGIVMAP